MRPDAASRPIRTRGAGLLRLYPRRWRDRYGPEMIELLRARPPGLRARLDLVRGAADAHLHPPGPSAVPGLAAIAGGLTWSLVALGVLAQPVPPDWPGYLAENLLPAALAAALLLAGVVGAWLRVGDAAGKLGVIAIDVAVAGHAAWVLALLGALAGFDYGPATAIAQTAAAAGTVLIGVVLLRCGDASPGALLVVAGCGLVMPSAWGWLATGLAWIAVGALELRERSRRSSSRPIVA